MSCPSGSDGKVGVQPPSSVYLNLLDVWQRLTGIIKASLITMERSDPEYPSQWLPRSTQSYSVTLFFVLLPLFLKIPALAVASGREI